MIVGVVGYGLIGQERVRALCDLSALGVPVEKILVVDQEVFRSNPPALPDFVCPLPTLEEMLGRKPELVIIATPHDTAAGLLHKVLHVADRVLVEKPLGRSLAEACSILADTRSERHLVVGFNYRFFPGIRGAVCDALQGKFGQLISVSMVLGHGGAPGMEGGWKFDPARAGGGSLIDPGIHLLDLCCLLVPEVPQPVKGTSWKGFWNTGIEEEVHLLLQSGSVTFNLQVSVVRWRSTFRMEIHGTEGYGIVTGRGRSYGRQIYIRGKRWGWQKAASQLDSEEVVVDSEANHSFRDELAAILGTSSQEPGPCSARAAVNVMKLYDSCRSSIGLE
jgi:predicted dehydrogenase